MVSQSNVQERFNVDEETWPPDQPKNFIPLVLIHHHGKYSTKETTTIAQLIQKHDIDEITSLASNQSAPKHHQYSKLNSHEPLQEVSLDLSRVTEELTEILAPVEQSEGPQFVLIEGAPGIGKSVLLKEIAYRWGKKQLLKMFKVVLLICLRDPTVQQTVSVSDLLQHFCEGNRRAAELAAACLAKNGGKDLMFLFDGFDEFHTELRRSSLIAKILHRKLLRNCTLIVSSRPHATAYLRTKATVRIDILGFSEVQRNQFIHQALEEQPQSSKELIQYLEDHLTISSLCVVPFNMVVLLYLYKLGISLPNNSTELYNNFICQTIYRHLAKDGHSINNITANLTNLPEPTTNLPEPYNKIIQQLSEFSLKALNDNVLVFTFDEIKNACPNIVSIPGTINGFGLLKAVEHYDINGEGTTITFNFLHFSIQEYLAALHVANLPPSDELKILREKFFQSDIHSNMFAIYIALTKGQRPSFKQFIKPSLGQRLISFLTGTQVANRFIDDQVKCFRLFRCFFEAGDEDVCKSIENAAIFKSKYIRMNCYEYKLSASDIVCLAIFLTYSSHKEWDLLDLDYCYIQDHGVRILHHELTSCKLTITELSLIKNGLTDSCSPAIIGIIISCRVKNLYIDDNDINICESEKLNSIISGPSSTLERLSIPNTKLSSLGAIKLFTALSEATCKLRRLYLDYNNDLIFTDKVCGAMVMAMKKNTSLEYLDMYGIPISIERMQLIIQALQYNNTLQELYLKVENIHKEDSKLIIIKNLVKEVNTIRKHRGCENILVVQVELGIRVSMFNLRAFVIIYSKAHRNRPTEAGLYDHTTFS